MYGAGRRTQVNLCGSIETADMAPKPGSPVCPGKSMEESYLLSMWCPVCRRRDPAPGSCTELENLTGDVKGKGTSGEPMRPKVLMHRLGADCLVVCAEQRMSQEGSSPSGARMRSAVSKSGGNASLAEVRGKVWRRLNGHEGESRIQPRPTCSRRSTCFGGQGVRSDPESEGYAEKYRAVIDWGRPRMNRSAKDGIRSSPHYGGEGVTHSPIAPRCFLAARFGIHA